MVYLLCLNYVIYFFYERVIWKLQRENQTEEQQKQVSHAASLYHELVKSGAKIIRGDSRHPGFSGYGKCCGCTVKVRVLIRSGMYALRQYSHEKIPEWGHPVEQEPRGTKVRKST